MINKIVYFITDNILYVVGGLLVSSFIYLLFFIL